MTERRSAMSHDIYGPGFLDRFKSKRKPATTTQGPDAPARLPRHQGLWASTPLNELLDRQNDDLYPARLRLLLLLQIRTRRGSKSVAVTNAMAQGIGLDRHQKRVCLKYLETQGRIAVERAGQKNPIVSLLKRQWGSCG
jgi:hypothetical protein